MLVSKSSIKKACLMTYLSEQLLDAELATLQGKGKSVTDNEIFVRQKFQELVLYFYNQGWHYERMFMFNKKLQFLHKYYDPIGKRVNKLVGGEGSSYIPALLVLYIIKKYQEDGVSVAPKDFDVDELLSHFNVKTKEKLHYVVMARNLIEMMKEIK